MLIHCKHDELIPVDDLVPHPQNRNFHPPDQIERLSKLIDYQGLRAPIIVSNLSKHIVKGHGTLQALKLLGWKDIPVQYQDFEDETQEYAFLQSDNAIAAWASLDLSGKGFISTTLSYLGCKNSQ
jgi:ParB-like chromosome segregation protein Spo0J